MTRGALAGLAGGADHLYQQFHPLMAVPGFESYEGGHHRSMELLLIILIVLLLFGGGGVFYRGRGRRL